MEEPPKTYHQRYYQLHRDHLRAAAKARYWANRERERELRRKYREHAKIAAIEHYGGVCACCGEWQIEFLALDHINGGGKAHRMKASGVGWQFYRWLARNGWPDDPPLRVLCHNCNQSIGFYGYCPHQRLDTHV